MNTAKSPNNFRDEMLPGLTDLLNPSKVCGLLADVFNERNIDITSCEIAYIRYKAKTNCIIAYRIYFKSGSLTTVEKALCYAKIHTVSDFPDAAAKINTHKWAVPGCFEPTIALPDLSAVLYFFPNDGKIEGLKNYSDPKKLQRLLYEHYDKYPENIWRISDRQMKLKIERYKPERRVVARCKTKAYNRRDGDKVKLRFYIRNYADDRGEISYKIQSELSRYDPKMDYFAVPYPIAYIPERKMFIMEEAPGELLSETLLKQEAKGWISRVTNAVAAFHQCKISGIPVKSYVNFIMEAKSTVEMIGSILPDCKTDAGEVWEYLSDEIDQEGLNQGNLVHGDLYYGQIILDKNTVYLIDFDRTHLGDNIYDLGNFCAHLQLLKLQNLIDDYDNLRNRFLHDYQNATACPLNQNRMKFWTIFSLFQLAVGPFRRLETGWPDKVRKILERCRKMI
jgi:tRNA A-37 threonylcarbamoyl transferase component Bud32